MNKLVKMPLFLGVTCLVCGGLLAGIVALTDPVIEKNEQERLSAAFRTMYDDESALVTKTIVINEEGNPISEINDVTHTGGESAVYKVTSSSSYERMTFYVGISRENNTVDAYYSLSTSTSSLGYGNFQNSDNISNLYQGYDGNGTIIVTGTSVTSRAVKVAVDACLDDYAVRYLGEGGNQDQTLAFYQEMYGESAILKAEAAVNEGGVLNGYLVEFEDATHYIYELSITVDGTTTTYYVGMDNAGRGEVYKYISCTDINTWSFFYLHNNEKITEGIKGKFHDTFEIAPESEEVNTAFNEVYTFALQDLAMRDWEVK